MIQQSGYGKHFRRGKHYVSEDDGATPLLASPLLQPDPAQGGGTLRREVMRGGYWNTSANGMAKPGRRGVSRRSPAEAESDWVSTSRSLCRR